MTQHPYRDADLRFDERHCLYCGAPRLALAAPCTGCQAAPAREGEPPAPGDALPCPRCATVLAPADLDGALVFRCATCLGCFVPERAWSALMARVAADRPAPLGDFVPLPPGRELAPSALCAVVRCPQCNRAADRITFGATSGVVVDVCPSHGIWFDAAEIVRVKQFVRAHDPAVANGPEARRAELEVQRRIAESELAARSVVARATLALQRERRGGYREGHMLEYLASWFRW